VHKTGLGIIEVDIDVGEKLFIRQKIVLEGSAKGQLALIVPYRLQESG
jgi:hypothetical protein